MAMLTEQEAKKIIDKVLSFSKADETSVTINGGRRGNIRFARNTVSTSGETDDLSLVITAAFGKRSGSANINELSDEAIKKGVKQAEETARLAPENPEYMPVLEPQSYKRSNTYNENTANITPLQRANIALKSITPCKEKGLTGAGYLEDNAGFLAIGNSKGLFGYNKSTSMEFSVSVRTTDGKGSGYAFRSSIDAKLIDAKAATSVAMQKAIGSQNAIELPPGKYTVILEPAAVYMMGESNFMNSFLAAFDARNAEEGRSFFGKKGGGTKLGEQLFDSKLTIYSDPFDPKSPGLPFAQDGRPQEKVVWVEKGKVKNFYYSRFWAQKKGVKAIPPSISNFIIEEGEQTLEEMIKNADKTILVTRTYYMRPVDPQNILVTGLTRDGVFYIENGRIKHAVKNFRFNESPVNMFQNLEAIGKAEKIGNSMVPPLKIRNFNFSSLSDAV